MSSKKKRKRKDPLQKLVAGADSEILGKLVNRLALARPEIRRECFEYLKGGNHGGTRNYGTVMCLCVSLGQRNEKRGVRHRAQGVR